MISGIPPPILVAYHVTYSSPSVMMSPILQ